jgi:hypothetical protein
MPAPPHAGRDKWEWSGHSPTSFRTDVGGASRLSWNGLETLHPHATQGRPFRAIPRHQDEWLRAIRLAQFACEWCIERLGIPLVSPTSSWTLDKEVFKNELTLTAVQRATTTKACYFAVRRRSGRGLNTNDFVFRRAVRTIERCR